jgi:sterol 14-demethylase
MEYLELLKTLGRYQSWPTSVWVLLITTAILLFAKVSWRPPLPKNTPKLLREGYPILGALRFYSARRDLAVHGSSRSATGNFSFYYGQLHIVVAGGEAARKAYFETKDLSLAEG